MKYFLILFVVAIGGAAYLRFEEPKTWNSYLAALEAPEISSEIHPEDAADEQSNSSPAPHPTSPEIISPDSNAHFNPEHIKQVEQPTPPATTNVSSTNSPPSVTNAAPTTGESQ
jgi:hypothetical protein